MVEKKKVVFLGALDTDIPAQLDKIRDYEQKPDWQVVVVATEYSAQRMCQQHGIPFKTTMDYLTTERHYRAFTESTRLAKEWYKQPVIEKTLSHDGVSLGEMIEYSMRLLFCGFFLDVELYQGILETEKPDRIALIKRPTLEPAAQNIMDMGRHDSFIVSTLSGEKGVSLEWITPISVSVVNTQRKAALKKSFLRRALNFAKRKLIQYVGMILLFNWRREIRRDFQRLWTFCFCSWTARRPMRIFSQKPRRMVFYGLRSATNIADYLRKDPGNGVVCLMGPGEKGRAMNFVPQIYLESFTTPEINAVVEEKRKVFRDILEQAELVSYLEKKFCYNDFNFWVISRKKLEYILDIYFPLMVRGMELMKGMIDKIGFDIFISSSDANPVIRTMMRALQHKGKKALVLHHGIDYFGSEASEVFGKCLVPPIADKIVTWGEASRDWFISQGAPSERMEAASCSDFDDYIGIFNHSKGYIRRYLRIPPNKKVILYALDHGNRDSRHPYIVQTRDEVIQHLKDMISEVVRFPQLYLIVRPHPGDRHPEEIEQIVQDEGQTNIMFSKLPLFYYLQTMDALVVYTSSSALEAMIFNKDVIIYNPTGRPELVPYAQDRAALKVERKEDLVPAILEVLENDSLGAKRTEERKKFVSRCAGPIDGRATEAIASLILGMINTN